MRDANYQAEVVTGGKNLHSTSGNANSKQMKKEEGVNFLSFFLFLLLRQNTCSLNWACGSGVGLKRGTLFNARLLVIQQDLYILLFDAKES